jgi:hypothetical protein
MHKDAPNGAETVSGDVPAGDEDTCPAAETTEPAEADESAAGGLVGHLQAVAEPVADAIGTVIGAANTALTGRTAIQRRLARQNREPLANLYDLYPEARSASPRELGFRFVPVEDIRGSAVAGAAQRGGDFLPLPPFRGENWEARWNRIRAANDRLAPLPPVDLIKYEGGYWVLDGHNRVAAALYTGGAGLDAMVTELVPLDGQTSERATNLAPLLTESGELRAAAAGHRPAFAMRAGDQRPVRDVATLDEPRTEERDAASAPAGGEA